jgi:hypothetical protein
MNRRINTAEVGWVDTNDNLACNSASLPQPVNVLTHTTREGPSNNSDIAYHIGVQWLLISNLLHLHMIDTDKLCNY